MAKDKNERIMFWTKAPERSDNYALRSGDGPDEKDDPTTYTPGEYMSIHLRVLKTGWKFRGLLLNAVSAAPPPKAGADCIYPKTSNTKCTGGTGAYTSLASAHVACVASASCTAVYQQNCDGGVWKICTTSTFSSSASESCVYKKAGGCTISHLRFGPTRFESPYEVLKADYIAVSETTWLRRRKIGQI